MSDKKIDKVFSVGFEGEIVDGAADLQGKADKPPAEGGKKKQKTVWVDDGRTVADMSGIGGFRARRGKIKKPEDRVELSRKEKRAIARAAFLSGLPVLGMVIAGMLAMILIIYLWLG